MNQDETIKPSFKLRVKIWTATKISNLKRWLKCILWNRATKVAIVIAIIVGIIYSMVMWNRFDSKWDLNFRSPIQNWIVITPDADIYQVPSEPTSSLVKKTMAKEPTLEDRVREVFGPHTKTFMKIANAESGQNSGNKNYNCYYGDVSKACLKGDEDKAWSVDCGFLQVNVQGKICPAEMYDLEYNLKAAKGKFDRQGFNAWTVCRFKIIICE